MAKAFPNIGATVIDTSADLPTASAALEGVMMFQKDTNELKICDGSSWVSMLDTDGPPAMSIMNPTSVVNATNTNGNITFSGAATVSINGCFTDTFAYYKVLCNFTVSVSTGPPLYFRFRGAATDRSGNFYYGIHVESNSGSSTITANVTGNPATFATIVTTSGNASINSVAMEITNCGATAQLDGSVMGNQRAGYYSTSMRNGIFGWYYANSDVRDGFTIYPASGTISGNLRVYGYRNSI